MYSLYDNKTFSHQCESCCSNCTNMIQLQARSVDDSNKKIIEKIIIQS